jgi:hypothetical protein
VLPRTVHIEIRRATSTVHARTVRCGLSRVESGHFHRPSFSN